MWCPGAYPGAEGALVRKPVGLIPAWAQWCPRYVLRVHAGARAVKADATGSQGAGSQALYDFHTASGNRNFSEMKALEANRMPAVGCMLGVNANKESQNQAPHRGRGVRGIPIHPRTRSLPHRPGCKAKEAAIGKPAEHHVN